MPAPSYGSEKQWFTGGVIVGYPTTNTFAFGAFCWMRAKVVASAGFTSELMTNVRKSLFGVGS